MPRIYLTKYEIRLFNHIYFPHAGSKKFRESILRMERTLMEEWPNLNNPDDPVDLDDRELAVTMAAFVAKCNKHYEKAKEYSKDVTISNREFRLYAHPIRKFEILEFSFINVWQKKHKSMVWFFPKGLPRSTGEVCTGDREGEEKLKIKGIQVIDEGTFKYRYSYMNYKFKIGAYLTLDGKQKRMFLVKSKKENDKVSITVLG